jgi:signal transduction histidine kinase
MSGWWLQGPLRRYGMAALLLAVAVVVRLALEPWLQGRFPFVAVLAAVGLSAWYAGPAPAALVAVAGFGAMHLGLQDPVRAWFGGPASWTLIGYGLSAGVLVAMGALQQHARRHREADRRERLASEQALHRSESLLRGLYESTRLCMGVVELTDDGDILHLQDNARTCQLFNVPPGGTVNQRASALGATPETIGQWRQHYLESARRQRAVDFSYFQQHTDGQHWYAVTVAPLPPVPGERQRFSYIIDDATDRRSTALHQRQSATQARLALDVAEIGTWSWDPARDVLRADRRCRELCGLSADVRLSWRDLIASLHEDDREGFEHDVLFARAPRGSGTYTRELRLVQPDGTVRWAVIRGQMLLLPDDDGVGQHAILLNTMLDITSRKHGEQALAESDRRKNEFIATLSHELRNPLAPLRTGVAMLRQAGDDAAVRERVTTTMERQLGHMVRMIDDLLDVSRITRDQLQLRRQPVPLAQVVTAALETAQPLIEARGHVLTVRPADLGGCGIMVEGDPARLTQVLANLLNNAAKYTPSGGHLDVALQADDHEVRLSVTDSGIGIAPALLPRVFDLFTQIDQDARASQGGLGIGLAISRRLMEMHGGRIEAESPGPGEGSRFTMVLPRLAATAVPAPPPKGAHDDAVAVPRRILVVDDNIDAAQTLCELLRLHGHDARAVHDGPAALQLFAQWPAEVALLDIGMPQMDGYELAGRLSAAGGEQAPLLVAVTGWGQQADRQRSADAGFDDHLVKPVDPVALLHLIDSLPLGAAEAAR